jgi:alpha-L-rhamnosidase
MFIAGAPVLSLARMKEMYEPQVNSGLTTLYEMFPKGGSYNHAWNASNTVLSKYVAGVRPTKVAWSEYEIMPTLAHFRSLKKTIPSVKGNIVLSIESSDDAYQLQLDSPEETVAVVGVPKGDKKIDKIEVNGKVVWEEGNPKRQLNGIAFENEDEAYVKFKLGAGEWKLTATYE